MGKQIDIQMDRWLDRQLFYLNKQKGSQIVLKKYIETWIDSYIVRWIEILINRKIDK